MNLNKKALIDEMVDAIREGRVTLIRNEYGEVKGVGVNKPGLQVSDVKYVKNVNGSQCVGNTLEDLKADEEAMNAWVEKYGCCNIMHVVEVAEALSKLSERDLAMVVDYVRESTPVQERVVERRVEVPASGNVRGLSDDQLAAYLSVEELKAIKNRANREGNLDVKNACRRALRRKGVEA